MTSHRDSLLELAQSVHIRLLELLDGMDYCLDWKAEADSWSVRQVTYHLLDTPPGGLNGVLKGLLSGDLKEYDLWADLDNITSERMEHDLDRIREEINQVFSGLAGTLATAGDQELLEKTVVVHLKSRGEDVQRNANDLLQRGFGGHWKDHLEQLQELRESLGFVA
ncbi:MAG: hypothetical protein BZY88_02735 [SAR202 cluster bacterium Io17-Chloro-G9]|nr:MAG: hypothetical protein BZY88_02735 [SAR202 cluster bacterium Io17-Chloro-G9]